MLSEIMLFNKMLLVRKLNYKKEDVEMKKYVCCEEHYEDWGGLLGIIFGGIRACQFLFDCMRQKITLKLRSKNYQKT